MDLLKQIERINHIDHLIRTTSTGTPLQLANKLDVSKATVYRLIAQLKEWEHKYLFKSKTIGKVSFMKIWNENQTIQSGDLIFTIIPKNHSAYVGGALAPALNSGKIQIGQKVNLKLSSYPENEYGVLIGEVKHISLVPNSQGLYWIDINLPEKLITTFGKEIEFKQEMQGTAEIITKDLRLIERVFYQVNQLLNQ